MTETWYYLYSGLRVVSDLQIPEWNAFEQSPASSAADVRIVKSPLPSLGEEESKITVDEYSFHVPEIAYYSVRGGREIFVRPESNGHARETRLFLLGTAWGALCAVIFHDRCPPRQTLVLDIALLMDVQSLVSKTNLNSTS